MLIVTPEGVINTAHLVSAKPVVPRPEGHACSVSLADGSTAIVGVAIGAFERACGTIVPAGPGFAVITASLPGRDEEGVIYSEDPVIAFRVGHGGEHDGPMPITVSGEPSTIGGTRWTLRQPNGRCFGPEHIHEDVAEFQAECEREAARARGAA